MSKWIWTVLALATLTVAACSEAGADSPAVPGKPTPTTAPATDDRLKSASIADFAAGCFWGSEGTFRKVPGVIATEVGYEGGHTAHPTYEQVCTHTTGHAETVRVFYDPAKVSYQRLVDTFFDNHDPTTIDRQGPDEGDSYRSVIFCRTPDEKKVAEADKAKRDVSGDYVGPIVTQIVPATEFTRAEEYHQDYFGKMGVDSSEHVCTMGNGKKH